MSTFEVTAILIVLAAMLAFLNHQVFKLPASIGLMIASLIFAGVTILVGQFVPGVSDLGREILDKVEFDEALMNVLLGFLLFAGALHVNFTSLWQQKWTVLLLATVGTLIMTFTVAGLTYGIFLLLGIHAPFMHCMIFGALIAPTDPVAVLAIIQNLGAPKKLETKIAGESLFNDGVGYVVFLAVLSIAGLSSGHGSEESLSAVGVLWLFIQEALGGLLLGGVLGVIAWYALKAIDDEETDVLTTLAIVAGGYALATALHLSGPLAMVVAGLMVGNEGRKLEKGTRSWRHVFVFWTVVDEVLNAILFVLIGLEVLILTFDELYIEAGLLAIPAVLLARFIAVALPVRLLKPLQDPQPHTIKVLWWSGLRGAISVALALSLQESLGQHHKESYNTILFMTYAVVTFSIIGQGLTIGPLLKRLGLKDQASSTSHSEH